MSQVFMFDDMEIRIDLKQSLTGATDPKILYKKPGGTVGEWEATISGTTLFFKAVAGELDEPGLWQFEGKILLDGTPKLSRSFGISTQLVDKPLNA